MLAPDPATKPAPVQPAKVEPAVVAAVPVAMEAVPAARSVPVVKKPVHVEPAAQAAPIAPPVQPAAQVPAPPAPEPDPDDALPTLAGLPPSLQGAIPRITLGGYIYSPIPAERLLLIDNNLRREGDEVASGLVLERLLPRAAVMNYRGTRFRMPY